MRFTIETNRWYACELIGDEFEADICSYSPIKILRIETLAHGDRTLSLHFYHANYPEGVRDKSYNLRTIERGEKFFLAKSLDHNPVRILQIYDISYEWVVRHFPGMMPDKNDLHRWFDRHL
jgi:hypothetical protein